MFYFSLGFNDIEIAEHCKEHYNQEHYDLRYYIPSDIGILGFFSNIYQYYLCQMFAKTIWSTKHATARAHIQDNSATCRRNLKVISTPWTGEYQEVSSPRIWSSCFSVVLSH
jgi:hypothetical protein